MINVFGSNVGKEELAEVADSIEKQWLGFGNKCQQFEKIFTERLSQPFLLTTCCSNALTMAVKLLDLPPESEIIVATNTWVSCGTAVVLNNCIPVFADCEYGTLNISKRTVKEIITKKTKAIIAVDYGGVPVDIEELKEFGLPIIEDAAHAVAARYKGQWAGTLGDIGVFSFDSMKNIAAGELGGLTCKDEKLYEKAIRHRYCGLTKSGLQASTDKDRWWEYEINNFCPKDLPSDIAACFALAQYKKLKQLQAIRRHIYNTYMEELEPFLYLELPDRQPDYITHGYFTIHVRVEGNRDMLARYLFDNGIYTTVRYQPLHTMKGFEKYARQSLPISEAFRENGLNLPLHPNLSYSDVCYIIEKLKSFNYEL
jgi:dTDP-4-amino-4,6-dideoxygalactose transaminase